MISISQLCLGPNLLNNLDYSKLARVVAVLLIIYTIATLIRFFSHPLKHIPGPLVSCLSSAPLFLRSLKGERARWIIEQHEKYGPVIRIAPHKIAVSASSGVKAIYNNKNPKSHTYDAFKYQDVKMCIALLDVKQAHTRRKALLPAFSRQNLLEMEPVIRHHLEQFLGFLEDFDRTNTPVDTFKWFRYLTFDVVTDIAFGQQIGMLSSNDTHFIEQVEIRNKRNSLNGPFPFILPIMRLLRMETAKKWDRADEEIAGYAARARDGWAKAGEANRHRVDILSRMEQAAKVNPDTALSDKEIIATMMEILNAGSDTTANTAMFASFELASNPKVQTELHQELVNAFPKSDDPLDFAVLEKLPILDGVCREALRIHAPIPSYLERIIAEHGLKIEGYDIPKGTVIGMQAYTNHRDPRVYPQPDEFIPHRWVYPTEEAKANFLSFSAGPRACIGLNLANMQLRIHLGHIFRKYNVSLAPETTKESMKHVEFFMVRPMSQACNLFFRKYESQG